MRLGGVQESC